MTEHKLIKLDDALALVEQWFATDNHLYSIILNDITNLPAIDPAATREAALQARIEELGGSLAWYQMMDAMCSDHVVELTDKLEAAEAKLAKAVEALEDLVRDCEADYPPSHGAIKHFAIATLAEIKGESQDGMV